MRGLVFWCCFGNLGCLGGWSCHDLVGGVRLCGQVAGCRTFLLARLCTLRAVACACVCHRVVCVSQLLGTVGRLLHTVAACDCNTGGISKRRVVPCSCVFDCQLARQHTLRICNGPPGRRSPGIIGSSVAWLKRCVGSVVRLVCGSLVAGHGVFSLICSMCGTCKCVAPRPSLAEPVSSLAC